MYERNFEDAGNLRKVKDNKLYWRTSPANNKPHAGQGQRALDLISIIFTTTSNIATITICIITVKIGSDSPAAQDKVAERWISGAPGAWIRQKLRLPSSLLWVFNVVTTTTTTTTIITVIIITVIVVIIIIIVIMSMIIVFSCYIITITCMCSMIIVSVCVIISSNVSISMIMGPAEAQAPGKLHACLVRLPTTYT